MPRLTHRPRLGSGGRRAERYGEQGEDGGEGHLRTTVPAAGAVLTPFCERPLHLPGLGGHERVCGNFAATGDTATG